MNATGLIPRVQIVRRVPTRYPYHAAVFTVPEGATVVRFATRVLAPGTGATRVWTVKIRPVPALLPGGIVGGFADVSPPSMGVTIPAGGTATDAVPIQGANEVVLECTTAEGGSADVFEDVCASFDRGGLVPSDRPYA